MGLFGIYLVFELKTKTKKKGSSYRRTSQNCDFSTNFELKKKKKDPNQNKKGLYFGA